MRDKLEAGNIETSLCIKQNHPMIEQRQKKLTSRVSGRHSHKLNAAGIFYFSSSFQILMQNTEE